jgi:hypothetical protein
MFKTAGIGYDVQFALLDDSGGQIGSIGTGPIRVLVGAMYRLNFISDIGKAVGGEVFSPNPVVNVVDRGCNTISTLMHGDIMSWLCQSPSPDEKLLSKTTLSAKIINGIGSFSGLFINTAGYPYAVCFNTSLEVNEFLRRNPAILILNANFHAFRHYRLIKSGLVSLRLP